MEIYTVENLSIETLTIKKLPIQNARINNSKYWGMTTSHLKQPAKLGINKSKFPPRHITFVVFFPLVIFLRGASKIEIWQPRFIRFTRSLIGLERHRIPETNQITIAIR